MSEHAVSDETTGMQVTRLLCGGFIVALRHHHAMCDAFGIVQFMSAVGELARGLPAPTISPAWSRELLEARSPPEPSFPHHEYDPVPPSGPPPPPGDDMVTRTFTFGAAAVASLKGRLRGGTATTFEALAASLWRAHTAALELPPGEDARLAFTAGVRGVRDLALPAGYYGNAMVFPMAVAAAGVLRGGTLGDAVELVQEAKAAAVSGEYARSTADVLALRGRPFLALGNLFILSDNRRAGFDGVDLGWGQPVYGGPAVVGFRLSFIVAVRNGDGEDAIAVPVMLPRPAMERFASEVKTMLLNV